MSIFDDLDRAIGDRDSMARLIAEAVVVGAVVDPFYVREYVTAKERVHALRAELHKPAP